MTNIEQAISNDEVGRRCFLLTSIFVIPCSIFAISVFMPLNDGGILLAQTPASLPAQLPMVVLFDTRAGAEAELSGDALDKRTGWTVIAEDTTKHSFAGDAVFTNGRLSIVLRAKGGGAELFSKSSRSADGWTLRATLVPVDAAGHATTELSKLAIVENSSAAVAMEAAYKTKGDGKEDTVALRMRLTAGAAHLEVRPGQNASKLLIRDQARYVVVPEFFTDDLVFDPTAVDADRVGLPAENMLLGLVGDGRAIIACMWQPGGQYADMLTTKQDGRRQAVGCRIDLAKDKALWIAIIDGPGTWHSRTVPEKEAGADIALDWKPPFAAKWRADFFLPNARGREGANAGLAATRDFAEGAATKPDEASGGCGCWLEGAKAIVRPGKWRPEDGGMAFIIYPIDRSKATPLTAYCVVDLMRDTLGMGPCQYVLDVEGLGAKDNATPDQVTQWVEKQLGKPAAKREPDAIRQQLELMAGQVKRVDERIAEYRAFATKARRLCGETASGQSDSDFGRKALTVLGRIYIGATGTGEAVNLPEAVGKLADRMAALAAEDNALDRAQAIGEQVRAIGASQDKMLARMRVDVRRLDQICRMAAGDKGDDAKLVAGLKGLVMEMLQKK
jgi:hypothetical protein